MEPCGTDLTVGKLKAICKGKGKKGYSRLRKKELVDLCCEDEQPVTEPTVEVEEETPVTVIQSWKRQGQAPEDEVLECKDENGGVVIEYAPFDYPEEYKWGKRNKIEIEVQDGIIVGKRSNQWVGKCEEMIDNADWVSGRTYSVKEDIKKKGFTWSRDEKRWKRVAPKPSETEPLDAWKVANLSFDDEECKGMLSSVDVPRMAGTPTLEQSCDAIVKKIEDTSLGNWAIYKKSRCQLVNDQTGWFINPRYKGTFYNIKVDRSYNYSSKRFENMWKPYFQSDDEYETFENVADCNGVEALDKFTSELRKINS